jgi:predicted HNH restriction endonuclease
MKIKTAGSQAEHNRMMSAGKHDINDFKSIPTMKRAGIYFLLTLKPCTMQDIKVWQAARYEKVETYSPSCRKWAESGLIAKDSTGRWHSLLPQCASYNAVVADGTIQPEWSIGDKQVRLDSGGKFSKAAKSTDETFRAMETVSELTKEVEMKKEIAKIQDNAETGKNNTNEGVKVIEQLYLPDQRDFEIAREMFQPLDEQIPLDQILDQIDIIATGAGHRLDHNWREVTEKNIIEKWLHENERGETEPTEDEIKKINKQVGNPRSPEEAQKIINELSAEVINKPIPDKIKIGRSLARNPALAKLVKERQNFKCEICGAEPFLQNNSYPYAEAHHIFELSKSRIDNPHYMICVCPTCHKVLHYGNNEALKNRQKY